MYRFIKKILFLIDSETVHNKTINILKLIQSSIIFRKIFRKKFFVSSPLLENNIHGINFKNPIGLAAGFDKSCEVAYILQSLGFGHIEIGGVTPLPQEGNQKPRLFRLKEDKAIINRMGFNNSGMYKTRLNYKKFNYEIPVGVNVGINKNTNDRINDFIKVIEYFSNDTPYFTINISSPNTKGLQDFHQLDMLESLIKKINELKSTQNIELPIFIKITSDISYELLDEILPLISEHFEGIIVANTTQNRDGLFSKYSVEHGGLSGKPLYDRNLKMIKHIYRKVGRNLTIIGTGGISNADEVVKMIEAGASIIQIYTALIYDGPSIVKKINLKLIDYMNENNISNISEMIGSQT